jgi:DNA ligase-4
MEQIWLVKIILKDLDIHLTENTILPLYHPDSLEYFKVCSDLHQLSKDLEDPNVKYDHFPIKLFHPFAPQLSIGGEMPENIPLILNNNFWIETKYDGERIQMHYGKGVFKWWSRNTTDYTETYGASINAGSLAPILGNMFCHDVEKCYFIN